VCSTQAEELRESAEMHHVWWLLKTLLFKNKKLQEAQGAFF